MGTTLVDESFEGTGYEEAWTEDVGAGCTLDEDSTDITPPWGGGSQMLKAISATTGWKAVATRDFGSEQSKTFTRYYVQITSEGVQLSNEKNLIKASDSSGNGVYFVRFYQDTVEPTGRYFRLRLYNNGGYVLYTVPDKFSLSQWYCIEVKYDDIANEWEWRIDGVSQNSGILTGTHYTGVKTIEIGALNSSQAYDLTAYYDLIKVSDTTWVDAETPWIDRIVLQPEADSSVGWTPSSGTDHYALVNDDSDATYVETDLENTEESFVIANPTEYRGFPLAVRVWVKGRRYATTERQWRAMIKIGVDIDAEQLISTDSLETYYAEWWL